MPLYRSKFSYTPETWTRLIRNPEDRRKAPQSYSFETTVLLTVKEKLDALRAAEAVRYRAPGT
jgi:hypothetical protein